MRKIIIGIFAGIFVSFLLQYIIRCEKDNEQIIENTALIQEQLKNVSKLVVTESFYSEIITYQDAKKYLGDLVSFDKKAIIVVNAEATVSYDMNQIKYDIDSENKKVIIKNIPQPEIKIYPKLSFYDMEASQFNPFTAHDYNKIRQKADDIIRNKIEQSSLKTNAQNRFITELSKLLVLTNSMFWTLEYNGNPIQNENDFLIKENHFSK